MIKNEAYEAGRQSGSSGTNDAELLDADERYALDLLRHLEQVEKERLAALEAHEAIVKKIVSLGGREFYNELQRFLLGYISQRGRNAPVIRQEVDIRVQGFFQGRNIPDMLPPHPVAEPTEFYDELLGEPKEITDLEFTAVTQVMFNLELVRRTFGKTVVVYGISVGVGPDGILLNGQNVAIDPSASTTKVLDAFLYPMAQIISDYKNNNGELAVLRQFDLDAVRRGV